MDLISLINPGRFKWEENMVSSSIFSPASLLRTIFLPVSSSTSGCGRESSEKIPVSQALKAHDVDVQCPVVRVESHDLLLACIVCLLRLSPQKILPSGSFTDNSMSFLYIYSVFPAPEPAGDDA